MLIGIAVLIGKFHIRPVDGTTVLAQVTNASLGHGIGFYAVAVSTTILLALAANTSFGGLPALARLLATDHYLPHVFALRADRQVYRYGVVVLAVVSGAILIIARGQMNTLVPLFAIGVFVGFTIAQAGMVRHWLAHRVPGWRAKVAVNGLGALLTAVATVVTTAITFSEAPWIVAVALSRSRDNTAAISSTRATRPPGTPRGRRPAPGRADHPGRAGAGRRPARNGCAAPRARRRPGRSRVGRPGGWTGSAGWYPQLGQHGRVAGDHAAFGGGAVDDALDLFDSLMATRLISPTRRRANGRSRERVSFTGEGSQDGGNFVDAGADVGRGGAGVVSSVGVAGVGAGLTAMDVQIIRTIRTDGHRPAHVGCCEPDCGQNL